MEFGQGVRVLALVAHPDDEAWALSPVLVALLRAGAEVQVCAATWGEAGVDLRVDSTHSEGGQTLAQVRREEFQACADRMGWRVGAGGGFRDGSLAEVDEADWFAWFSELKAHFPPTWWLTLAPDGGYGHRDHIALTNALMSWAESRRPAVNVWGWCAPPEQARGMRSLVNRVAPRLVDPEVAVGELYRAAPGGVVVEDAPEIVRRSLLAHGSQLPGGVPERFFGAGFWRGVRSEQRLMQLVGTGMTPGGVL
jgi:LmbE family N-acetylglucosaminyl deacetylase